MNSPELEQLIETARRRRLSAAEQSRLDTLLQGAPAAWPERDDELALTRLLAGLPDAPLASNFSARVMQAIDLAEAQAGRESTPRAVAVGWWPHRWFGRLAWTTAALVVSGFSWMQYQGWQRSETARSIQVITEVATVPSVAVLKDFDAIQSFASVPPTMDVQGDLELLNALQ
jgi:hypothetical protein